MIEEFILSTGMFATVPTINYERLSLSQNLETTIKVWSHLPRWLETWELTCGE